MQVEVGGGGTPFYPISWFLAQLTVPILTGFDIVLPARSKHGPLLPA